MRLTSSLTRNSLVFSTAVLAVVLCGFWKSYFSNPFQVHGIVQIHGIGMTLWCVMLFLQAFLIKAKRLKLHRLIGMASYVLVPVNVVLMLTVVHIRTPTFSDLFEAGALADTGQFFVAQSFANAGLYAVLYALAMVHRRNPGVHARFMLCTPLAVIAAATDRIIYTYAPGLVSFWIEDVGAMQMATLTWLAVDCGLLALAIYDWRVRRPVNVFATVLGLFLAFHIAAIAWIRIPPMRAFGNWFLGI